MRALAKYGRTLKIAVSGKGGVGKTLIAGALAAFLAKRGFKVLAIDADPSPNLALTLGIKVQEASSITPLFENKELIELKTSTAYPGVYKLYFSVDDVVENYTLKTPLGIDLLVMGTVKDAGEGCTCPANALVRSLMKHLLVDKGEAVVMDMEAGVEHLGRGTARHVDHMLIASEAGIKSLEAARKIYELSSSLKIQRISLVGNKVTESKDGEIISQFAEDYGIRLLGLIPYDENVVKAERDGKSLLMHLKGTKAIRAIEEVGEKLLASKSDVKSR